MTHRYKVAVNLYFDAENDTDAEDMAMRMMCGTTVMARMWEVENVAEVRV